MRSLKDMTGMTGPAFQKQCDERGEDYDYALEDLAEHLKESLDDLTWAFEIETGV